MTSVYGLFRNNKFGDLYTSADDFVNDFNNSGVYNLIPVLNPNENIFNTKLISSIYYLLYSRFGNSIIASTDTNRFKENMFSIIIQNTPAWLKKSQLQSKLRAMTEEEIETSYSSTSNTANNPNDVGITDELNFISQQNTVKAKKGKISAYADYIALLSNDYTEVYLNKFRRLFLSIIEPQDPLLYESEVE